jgi:hypothetical protein
MPDIKTTTKKLVVDTSFSSSFIVKYIEVIDNNENSTESKK